MGEHTVDLPLWDDDALMFATPAESMQSLGPLARATGWSPRS
jgi:hypothetical protein